MNIRSISGRSVAMVLLILAMAALSLPAAATNAQVSIADDVSAAHGAKTTTPILITQLTEQLGAATIVLAYDADVEVVSVTPGTMGDFAAAPAIDNPNHKTTITWFKATGVTGDQTFAQVELKALGAAGETSTLDIQITTFDSTGGAAIGVDDDDGLFTITAPNTYYADDDNDGYGDPDDSVVAGSAPAGYVEDNTDCDDTNAAGHPGATEVCNGIDDDCDTLVDDADPDCVGLTTYYRDADGDGYGDPNDSVDACTAPAGYVDDNTDCDDTNAAVHPGATEVCNGIDDDCDTLVDEGVTTTYYADADGDGYGDPDDSVDACTAPAGYVDNSDDCDDTNAAVHPGATEVCNGIDDNCDGEIDEGFAKNTYYGDADGDGYGDPANTTEACAAPAGYVDDNTDCDDTNAAVNPGASEVPDDGIDNNCNGVIDEDFCLNLNAGWNFVSIPKMVNGSNDAETVFDIGDYDLCEYYDVHEGRWLDLDEITVEPTRGYLVSKNNPEMLCLDFSDSPLFPSAQPVYAGDFNMIGFPSMDGMSVSDFKTATGLEFSMIMQWDSGYYSTGYMTTGRGYLIWPTANGSMPGMI